MNFKPTYLYIKQHAVTGLLYFGKTAYYDPIKYLGSGKHWIRHIKKHGTEHVVTLWHELFTDKDSLVEFALNFSKEMSIVESKSWANLKDENGLDGGNRICTQETREKIRNSKLGIPRSSSTREKIQSTLKCRVIHKTHPMLGHVHSSEAKEKIRQAATGKIHSESTKNKISESIKGLPRVVCPHCAKIGEKGNMHRWHFENCKIKIH